MVISKEQLTQQLDNLNREQLKQVSDFIAFLKFKDRSTNLKINEEEIEKMYQEFAEEDKQLAEIGIDEYTKLLSQEDN